MQQQSKHPLTADLLSRSNLWCHFRWCLREGRLILQVCFSARVLRLKRKWQQWERCQWKETRRQLQEVGCTQKTTGLRRGMSGVTSNKSYSITLLHLNQSSFSKGNETILHSHGASFGRWNVGWLCTNKGSTSVELKTSWTEFSHKNACASDSDESTCLCVCKLAYLQVVATAWKSNTHSIHALMHISFWRCEHW